jgi:hypothetical protein
VHGHSSIRAAEIFAEITQASELVEAIDGGKHNEIDKDVDVDTAAALNIEPR